MMTYKSFIPSRKSLSKDAMNKPWNVTHHSGKINFANRVMTIQRSNDSKSKHVYWVAPREYLGEGVSEILGSFHQ